LLLYLVKNEIKGCSIYPQTFLECFIVPILVAISSPQANSFFICGSPCSYFQFAITNFEVITKFEDILLKGLSANLHFEKLKWL